MEKYFSKKSFYFFLALLVFVQEAKGRSYQLESKRRDVANAGYQTQNDDKKPAAMKENEEKSVFWNDEYCENCLVPDSLSADSMEETRGKSKSYSIYPFFFFKENKFWRESNLIPKFFCFFDRWTPVSIEALF